MASALNTASIYFRNGTIANVAKIDGGPQYRDAMKAAYIKTSHLLNEDELDAVSQAPLRSRGLCDHLPAWMCRRKPSPFEHMLRALKSATESFLEEDLKNAVTVSPFSVFNLSDFRQDVHHAFNSLSLRLPFYEGRSAAQLVANYLARNTNCDHEETLTLDLAIEYSRSALTGIVLLDYNKCFYQERRVLHDATLGSDLVREYHFGDWKRLDEALRDIAKLPLHDGWRVGDDIAEFTDIFMLGESARDEKLLRALEDVLEIPCSLRSKFMLSKLVLSAFHIEVRSCCRKREFLEVDVSC